MDLSFGAKTAVKQCMNVKSGERVLILTDRKMPKEMPLSLKEVCEKLNAKITLKEIEPLVRSGVEPDRETAELMKEFDVEFLITSKSLSHTNARREACKCGARIASMPKITEFSFTKGGLTANYFQVKKLCEKMFNQIKDKKEIKITSKNGTELEMSIGDHYLDIDEGLYHKPGDFGNLPAGEVDTAPNDESTNGVVVIDSMGRFGKNIKIEIEDGVAKNIKGCEELLKEVNDVGNKARVIAEIGIGTNPKAKIIGNVLEDEKVFGTIHIALGNNVSYGGKNNVAFHQDGIVVKPTLIADGRVLIKNGKWLI